MKKIIILAIVLQAVSVAMFGQTNTNKVYWVHGLGDRATVWNTYRNALISRENRGTSIQWYMSYPLQYSADTLNTIINSEVPSSKKAIVFGHSAGGLVARQAARKPGNRIRAIITAGTPNNGAGIVTSINNRSFNNVARKAIGKVQASLSLGAQAIGTLLPGVGNAIAALISGGTVLIGEVGKGLADNAIEDVKNAYNSEAAVCDMDPNNSSFLRSLNSSTTSIPIINIYGNEDDNRLVRIAGTAMHKADNDSPSNTTDQCYDQTAFPYYNGAIATCTTFEVIHASVGATAAVVGIFCPSLWAASAMNISAAVSWADTRRFIQYDVHNEWDRAIGATHVDRIENWRRFLWIKWCDVEYVTVYENSDGFIPNKSSIMSGSNVLNHEIKGVNHLEMNSHIEMRRMLQRIYSGQYDKSFNPKDN